MTHEEKERNLIELLPWIRRDAIAFCRRVPVSIDDVTQEALLAAWVALDCFDESRGYQVWTFLRPRVMGAMLDYVRHKTHQFANNRKMKHKPLGSLNRLVKGGHDKPRELGSLIEDYRETPQDRLEADESFAALVGSNEILRRLYYDDENQREVALAIGRSPARVSQLHADGIAVIRERLERRKELRQFSAR